MQDEAIGRQETAAAQIVGFILMFAMTFIVLTVAMVVVSERVRDGHRDARLTLLAEVGAAIADAVREAVAFADLHADAAFVRRVDVPHHLSGTVHTVTVTNVTVRVEPDAVSGDVLRFGGYNLTASGIYFEETTVHGSTVRVAYERCDPGETTGICAPVRRRDRKNLVLDGGAP